MKTSLLLAILFSFATGTSSQTPIDKLTDELEFLSSGSVNNWRYSTSLSGEPWRHDFVDSKWEMLQLNQSIYPDSCWIRREIVLPERVLGQPIKGTVRFLVSVDDYGYLWVNGESKGHFPWDGDFVLTQDAKPGQRFLIAIKAVNTGGPLRLIRAQLATESSATLKQTIEDFALSLRVGQKLLSFDTYQTNARVRVDPGTDKSNIDKEERKRLNERLQSVVRLVDLDALKAGDIPKFLLSLDVAREKLKPVRAFAKRFSLFFDANAHIDAAWLWREKETIEVCKNTFASVINMMNARPDFTYTQSSAVYYDWMERLYPDLFKKIQGRVKDGRWEIVGGMWVEPDCNLPSGESWSRHLLYAKRYFKTKFGVDVAIGWNPDSFGYNANMPLFYRNAGIDVFITQKIGWNDTNVFPHRLFWWESPDGSRILSYFPFDYVNTIDDPFRLVDWLRQFEANTGFTKMMMLFGVGDHGGGPSLEMLQRIDRLRGLDIFPTIEHGTAATYVAWLKQQALDGIPVWRDELYLEYHQGTFTTQSAMKHFNRSDEVLLTNAEKFATFATTLLGEKDQSADLQNAWQKVLFNQFHDLLPGSSIREVYIDASETHIEAETIGRHVLKRSLDRIASQVSTNWAKNGTPIVVFNPLPWERSETISLNVFNPQHNELSIFGNDGKEIPSQIIQTRLDTTEIIFHAHNVPSLGYATYEIRTQKARTHSSALSISSDKIENSMFRITIDAVSGWVKSILDKRSNTELLKGHGNRLELLEDKPSAWDAWNIGLTRVEYPTKFRGAEIVESGPVRSILRLHRDYLKPGTKKGFPTEDFPSSFFTQDIVLHNGSDRIDFVTAVDWWEDKTMLKVTFPLTVSDTVATYEIPYGTIQRSTQMRDSWEKAKVEVPAHRWADLSNDRFGVSLLNKAKYGYETKGSVMKLSLLRSPKWPDPTADRGKHRIEYALYPHEHDWKRSQTVRRAYEYNNPLIATLTSSHKGTLPTAHSFASIEPSNVVLTSIKKAEDDDAWIVQMYEAQGGQTSAKLTLPRAPKNVILSNILEDNGAPLAHRRNVVTIPVKKHATVTVKILF